MESINSFRAFICFKILLMGPVARSFFQYSKFQCSKFIKSYIFEYKNTVLSITVGPPTVGPPMEEIL